MRTSRVESASGPEEILLLAADPVPTDLVAYLAAKPFLILTGPAGTGKSRGVIDLAISFDYGAGLPGPLAASAAAPSTALAFIPVGADWTDERALLGYRNPFGPERTLPSSGEKTNLTYEITPAVYLMLRASHPLLRDEPHFLVLDEMNLSHVERYFSSFLSIMEADQSVGVAGRFELVGGDDIALMAQVIDRTRYPVEGEALDDLMSRGLGLSMPANVFVAGTVNVDETTYMFSPKVLDRAFVKELSAVDPGAYLSGGGSVPGAAPGVNVLPIFRQAIAAREAGAVADPPLAQIANAATEAGLQAAEVTALETRFTMLLSGLYKLLSPVGFAFGYRVVNEAATYLSTAIRCSASFGSTVDTDAAMDDLVLAKVLPKVHGNRRQLGSALAAVAAFLAGKAAPDASYTWGTDTIGIEEGNKLTTGLPRSAARAELLDKRLQATGYTTFIA